jgi:hypothetical protein
MSSPSPVSEAPAGSPSGNSRVCGSTRAYRSKTVSTWLAVLGGTCGLHRFYLYGWADVWAWLHTPMSLLGLAGALRMRAFGQDDHWAWALIPVLGLMIAQSMAFAIVYALQADEAWDARRNPGHPPRMTRWGPVLGAVVALAVGATVLMGTIAFGGQKFFEWQLQTRVSANG